MRGIDIDLLILNESRSGKLTVNKKNMHRCLRMTAVAAGMPSNHYEVSLYIVDDVEMRRLNNEHRNISRTTDVLSFPQFDSIGGFKADPDGRIALGDIVISMETLDRRIRRAGGDIKRDFTLLLVHGLLHLAGFDHKTRRGRVAMRKIETYVIDTIFG